MAATKKNANEIVPEHEVRFNVTLTRGDCPILVSKDKPLPESADEFFREESGLIAAIRKLRDRLVRMQDKSVEFNAASASEDLAFLLHVIVLEAFRLRATLPIVQQQIPRYPLIIEFDGTCGESFAEIGLKIGEAYSQWILSARPVRRYGNRTSPVLSREKLGDWEFSRQLAVFVADKKDWLIPTRLDDDADYSRLNSLLNEESRRVKPSKIRNDEPTDTEVKRVASVMNGMSTKTPKVEAIKDAVKGAGFKMSGTKIGKAVTIIREQ